MAAPRRRKAPREIFASGALTPADALGVVITGSMQLARLVRTALDETRMLVLGAQILLGFELSGVFRDGFENTQAVIDKA